MELLMKAELVNFDHEALGLLCLNDNNTSFSSAIRIKMDFFYHYPISCIPKNC